MHNNSQEIDHRLFIYRIDADARIIFVNDHWLEFAKENGATTTTEEQVLNHSLWDYISGEATIVLYKMLTQKVRKREIPLVLPLRCDAPTMRRYIELEMYPLPEGQIEFNCRIIKQEPRQPVALIDPQTERSGDLLVMCSWCKRIESADQEWVEVEAAVEQLKLFMQPALPKVTHGICPSCRENILRML